jgi:hypothetical protein
MKELSTFDLQKGKKRIIYSFQAVSYHLTDFRATDHVWGGEKKKEKGSEKKAGELKRHFHFEHFIIGLQELDVLEAIRRYSPDSGSCRRFRQGPWPPVQQLFVGSPSPSMSGNK